MDMFVSPKKLSEEQDDTRILELSEFFTNEYCVRPQFFVKVPGRVNIIGEHVDYCGYPVLPLAISQNVLLAVAPADNDILQLKNIDSSKYKGFKCNINSFKIEKPEPNTYPHWHNYFLCGVKGVLDYLEKAGDIERKGFLVAVSGNIPVASGLSSSSALVCSSVLTTAYLHNLPLNRQLLATISASCEQFIGTIGGGMDQAIAFLAKKGCAQFIEFHPLTATPVQLPQDSVFVIANCLSEANKAATSHYNSRVVECRLGCKLIAKQMDLPWRDIDKFADLQHRLDMDLTEIESLASEVLTQEFYTRDDLVAAFEIEEEEFVENLLTPNTKNETAFKLRQRAMHVFQESLRVEAFRDYCNMMFAEENDSDDWYDRLSKLMRQSQHSLQGLYECSHPNLDKLVQISEKFGVSARLTGAGWGGCIVALCDSINTCDQYISELKQSYYDDLPEAKGKDLDEIVFATFPQNGAELILNEF